MSKQIKKRRWVITTAYSRYDMTIDEASALVEQLGI
jgi:hypothetical protein